MRRRALVTAALMWPTVRSLPWRLFAAGWGLGLVVAAVPVLFSLDLPAAVLVNVVRVAALCGAVGMAFVLDDPARHTTGVAPVPRPLRQALRVAAVLLGAALWWTAVLGVVRAGTDAALPVGAVTVEAAALSVLGIALAGAMVRFTTVRVPGPAVAGAVPALPLLAGAFLPHRFALFVPPGDPRWAAAHALWAGALSAGLALWAACGPEPRRRSGGVRVRRGGGG